jgi:hypothetical protein
MSEKPLNVGDKIKDNDPRCTWRAPLEIIDLLPNGVTARTATGSYVRILRRRIYTDGKPRRNGFSLVTA